MAKFVIAGQADCPYYARAELLGDKLAINLPDFKLHKIVKTPAEWPDFLKETCQTRGWGTDNLKSPLVWRELIDRGGKGVLIGGANEFQEYAMGYYGIESQLLSQDMKNVAGENQECKTDVDKEEKAFRALSQPVHVCITNASSNVCYAMLDALSRGDVLGNGVELIVHLLDSKEKSEYLGGMKMEAEDLGYGLLRGVVVESDTTAAFTNASYVILLDEIVQGEKNKDTWVRENHDLFVKYAEIIDKVASKSVKVLITGDGPVNFNAYMMIKNAPSIPKQNIVAMSRLVENRSKSVIAERLNVNTAGVVDLIIWGNPNGEHYIDVHKSRVHGYDGAIVGPDSFSLPVPEMVFDKKWLETEYIELVKTKQARSEEAMKHPGTFCKASAINSTLSHWCNGSPSSQMFSLGVCSDGWYGVPKDLVFSYPITFHPKGYWNVVQDIDLTAEVKAKVLATIKDLESEIEVIFPRSKPPTPEPAETNTNNQAADGGDKGEDQRLETIVEEKKEHSEEETDATATTTDAEKTETEGEATQSAGETTEDQKPGETTQDEAPKEEEQLPTE